MPPIPQAWQVANASAIHSPSHEGLGHMEKHGEQCCSQDSNRFTIRWESPESFLLVDLGSSCHGRIDGYP